MDGHLDFCDLEITLPRPWDNTTKEVLSKSNHNDFGHQLMSVMKVLTVGRKLIICLLFVFISPISDMGTIRVISCGIPPYIPVIFWDVSDVPVLWPSVVYLCCVPVLGSFKKLTHPK